MKITNQELEKFSKEYTIEEATEKGTKKLEEQIEAEIEEKQNILRKKRRSSGKRRILRNNCNIWSDWKYRNAGKNRRTTNRINLPTKTWKGCRVWKREV